jgi:hypothetical protein
MTEPSLWRKSAISFERACYSSNPNFPALFSLNRLPSRIYLRIICTLRWPVWFIIDLSVAPAIAALCEFLHDAGHVDTGQSA